MRSLLLREDAFQCSIAEPDMDDAVAARPNQRVVVGPERATAYLEWLQQQKHLLLGFGDGNK